LQLDRGGLRPPQALFIGRRALINDCGFRSADERSAAGVTLKVRYPSGKARRDEVKTKRGGITHLFLSIADNNVVQRVLPLFKLDTQLFATSLTSFRACWALAVICFVDLAVGFCHFCSPKIRCDELPHSLLAKMQY
jgi:hypothetical protein